MKLDNVYKVAVVHTDTVVNTLLDHGWKLLEITTNASTDDRYVTQGVFQFSEPCFICGATKEIAESYPISKAKERHYP